MDFDALLPFVLPSVKDCAAETARFNLLQSAIEFCSRSLVWREYQTPVMTVDGQVSYAFAAGAGKRVCKLFTATMNLIDVPIVAPSASFASGEAYIIGRYDGFDLWPNQVEPLPVVTFGAVCPTLAAETIPDWLERYAEQIGRGALARIMAMPNHPFTSPGGAAYARQMFENDISEARWAAAKGFSRGQPRTVASWF